MKTSVFLLLAVIAGTLLANVLLADNGYVAISFHGYLIEMSVPALVLVVLLIYLAMRLLVRIVRLPQVMREQRLQRRLQRARDDLGRGIIEMASGRWRDSEQTLTRSARDAATPAVHYLSAARAAELQGRGDRRDAWLTMAREAAPDEMAPVLISQAEFALKHKDNAGALAALNELEKQGALSARPLLLLARVYRQNGDLKKLRALEPRLRDTRGIPPESVDEIMDTLYLDMVKDISERGDEHELEHIWSEASRAARHRAEIVTAYARALSRFGKFDEAEKRLRTLLDADWHEPAIQLYGELTGGDVLEMLRYAEAWLRGRREDPALLMACARLCLRAELYGKARSYLETSLSLRPRPETYQLLAQLLEELGERERAGKVLHDGLTLAIGRKTTLPPLRLRRFGAPRR